MNLVLIHGMGRFPTSMLVLAHRLRKCGHTVHLFGYYPTFETLDHATKRLAVFLNKRVGSNSYGMVGHSLGTVIIRNYLNSEISYKPKVCYFLAAPMVACRAAKYFSRFWLYRLLAGEMGQLLAQENFMRHLPLLENTKIYAGLSGPRGSWLPFGNELNDCILSLEEATGNASEKVVQVESSHTFIMYSQVVFRDMAESLKELA